MKNLTPSRKISESGIHQYMIVGMEHLTVNASHTLGASHPSPPTEKKFGIFMGCFLLIVSLALTMREIKVLSIICAGLGLVGLTLAFLLPRLLKNLNIFWFNIGRLIGKVSNPIVLGVIFFLLLTPVAVTTRFFKRDALRLRSTKGGSLWITRDLWTPKSSDYERQF